MPAQEKMPSTIRRSPAKAQRTWAKTYDSAVEQYGHGRRANQTAMASLKHSFQKVGDHWEPKNGRGPSDAQAARGRGQRPVKTAGGVNANASKQELMDIAKRLDVSGRSRMNKPELVDAIQAANRRATARKQPSRRRGS
jgi:ChaB/Rho termination factor, N-terminal domain